MQMQRISLFFLLSLPTLLFLWFAHPGDNYIMFFKEFIVSQIDLFAYFFELIGEGVRNILDGCHHVYLDMGSNTGVQIRWKLKISRFLSHDGSFIKVMKTKIYLIMYTRNQCLLHQRTNKRIVFRKLYEPHNFPNSSVFKIFDKYFGDERHR